MKVFSPSNALAIASFAGVVQAHGYLSQPKATYTASTVEGVYYTGYNAVTDASINSGFDGGTYNSSPELNAQSFTEHWNATGYSSLREMLDPIAPDYGLSSATATPVDVSSFTEMWWQNDEYQQGFLPSHQGPCEAWIDDVRVFHHDDCAAEYTSFPAKVPTDYSSCEGDCLFVFYWLALHSSEWQIYKQCAPITNGQASTTSTAGEASYAADAATPEATTAVPEATAAAVEATTTAEEGATTAPEATESAKCNRRKL